MMIVAGGIITCSIEVRADELPPWLLLEDLVSPLLVGAF